jgi:hypothetical protein
MPAEASTAASATDPGQENEPEIDAGTIAVAIGPAR